MKRANIITSIVMLLFSGYMGWESIRMEYTIDGVPGPGFIPLWTAIFIALVSLIILFRNAVRNQPDTETSPGFDRRFWRNSGIVIGASAVSLLLIPVIGMLTSTGLLTGFMSWALGTKNVKTNVSLAIGTPVLFWLVFEMALEVTFPKGLLGF